ncbi:CBM35 domain-containing protein [Kutzneria chonburiensis]|uniref:CBM35 domain-containing protein n=1 Tax=Kutzneria chonburiensis TaxID=1483604 RepID=A0ABV6MN24_9PSEU|nr:CBM35 domain-containing protein [Kutzneria chonburiensis]
MTLALIMGSVAPALAGPSADTLNVDLSQTTGTFRGGASGTLYGLGDDGVPSQAVLDGAHVTNTSQKPPDGLQHPSGDALNVEKSFFAGSGKDLYVYVQDAYPDWPYNSGHRPGDADHDGVWDYLPVLKAAVEKVATKSAHPRDYIFIPFNEPDGGNWYPNWSTQKDQFLADWSAAYDTIQSVYAAHGLGHAKIGGPGDSSWHADRSTDFLSYAKAHNQLPDVFIWHELGTNNLATFRGHVTQYRQLLTTLGIPEIPVNITEYGMLRDMGVPGQLVQWLAMFEDAKVDAQTAFWNYAGNLSDNSSRNNGANGGWWMFKWYGDLTGARTVKVTPPQLNVPDTLQAIGAVDTAQKKATVLVGGGSNDVAVNISGVDPKVFGSSVHVQVRQDRLNGAEGASLQPPVVVSATAAVVAGKVTVTIPNRDRYAGYQVELTPATTALQPVATDLVNTTEAENATLTDATVYAQDPSREWSFMASGSRDVGSFNKADSAASWSVTVPRTGTYRLSILSGSNQQPGQHAFFVDGTYNQLVKYSADLGWGYRGTADVTVSLSAGTHTLSVRASKDGSTVLPGADITLDRFDLYDVTNGEQATYPAVDARLAGGASLTCEAGRASLSGSGSATFFATTAETGYYDVTTQFRTTGASALALAVNGRAVQLPAVSHAGPWNATVRVFLPQGVNELKVTAPAGATLDGITTLRGAAQKAADANPANVFRSEAEALPMSGAARVQTDAAGSNGSADASGTVHDVGYLGNGAGNTLGIPRPSGFGAGDYQLVLGAANADKAGAINYNPQVISRFLDITESGGAATRAAFRNDYAWNSYWDKTIPLTLTTATGTLLLGNATAYGPNLDTVTLAKFVAGAPTVARSTGR